MQVQQPSIELHQVHRFGAQRISFSPSGERLASGGLEGDIRIWSVASGKSLQAWRGHKSGIRGLAWLDEQRLISADKRGELIFWDLSVQQPVQKAQLGRLQSVVLSTDHGWLLAAQDERLLRLSAANFATQASADLGSKILSVAISANGDRVAASLSDGKVFLLDSSLQYRQSLEAASSDAFGLRFSPDGQYLYGGSWFHLLVWKLTDYSLEERPSEHLGKIISLDVSPDGRQLLTIGRITDSSIRLVDADTNQVLRRFRAHELCGWQARFSPNGHFAASSSEDGAVHIYNLREPYAPELEYPAEN